MMCKGEDDIEGGREGGREGEGEGATRKVPEKAKL
jgi:hypothetical protein